MLDCAVVGTGVAGVSAALTLKANRKNFILLGSPELSLKISSAENIRNYPGLTSVSGRSFTESLKKQLCDMDIAVTDERVTGVYAMKDKFSLLSESGASFESRTVILACGVESVRQIEGETEFVGRGVSYCATCDGFLYKGKTIAVVCTSKRFEREAEYLSQLAGKVYWIPLYKNAELEAENIEKLVKMPVRIEGRLRAERLIFKDCELPVDGIFMLKESVSPAVLVGGLETKGGHVAVKRDMSTNLKGCFAAGDCTGRPYQYAKAAGEGNVAAHAVCEFLSSHAKA